MNTDDIKGKLKETGGELTGDERLANEGRADQVKGKVKDAFEDLKDAAEHARDAAVRDDEPRNP
ncbi:MAG: CsbD-like [Solirubrobacteraceae bacterium]|nr:CsbD-like [Solirubrobacteraceae bacterium]